MAAHTTDVLVSEGTAQSSTSSPAILKSARAQTGFDSYHAYLHFHNEDTDALERLCGPLRPLTDPREETISLNKESSFQKGSAVLNVSEAGQLSIDEAYCTQSEEDGLRTDMVEALCHPSPGTKVQIAMWDTLSRNESNGCEALGDLIGLCYHLDPVVLRAMDASFHRSGDRHQRGLDRLAITHAKVGQLVATLLHPKNGTNASPLVLIAGPPSLPGPEFGWRPGELFESCPPFNKSSGDEKKPFHLAPLYGVDKFYPRQLDQLLSKYHDNKTSVAECTLICLLSLLQLSFLKIHYWLSVSRDCFENPDLSESDRLYSDRALLRTLINDMESDWWSIRRYMKSCFHCELSGMRCYQDADDDVRDFVEEASRLEGQFREHLQLQNGIRALEESKKSIEVSNKQIQEGKRVKTFTILAFVYVPLNLASSIYGMNIQQLNGTGQSVWVFVVTAVVALLITAVTWYSLDAANTYRIWHRKRAQHEPRSAEQDDKYMVDLGINRIKQPDFNLAERIAMIVWLQRNRYTSWMRSTGAWWKILLNRSDPITVVDVTGDGTWQTAAGDLVSRYSFGELDDVDLRKCKAANSEEMASPVAVP